MAEMEIDVVQVAQVATGFEQSADAIGAIAAQIATLTFGTDKAGRNYGDVGARIAAGYDGVESSFRQWGVASKDNTVRLRASVASYQDTDGAAARSIEYPAGER